MSKSESKSVSVAHHEHIFDEDHADRVIDRQDVLKHSLATTLGDNKPDSWGRGYKRLYVRDWSVSLRQTTETKGEEILECSSLVRSSIFVSHPSGWSGSFSSRKIIRKSRPRMAEMDLSWEASTHCMF